MTTITTEPPKDLLLPEHHRQIEAAFEDLRYQVRCDDQARLRASWDRFERMLEDHFRAEEDYLLPAFASVDPDGARTILADHEEIRQLVAELGVSVDLHAMRVEVADRLVRKLRVHALREDLILYPWASTHLSS